MSAMTRTSHLLGLFLGFSIMASASGCGGRAFNPEFRDVAEPERSKVIDALDTVPERKVEPVVVGVSGSAETLFAWDLEQSKMIWSRPVKAKSAPVVAGSFVVIDEGDGIVVRYLKDGKQAFGLSKNAFGLSKNARLVGADGDGDSAVISLDMGEESNPRAVLVGVQEGKKKWTNNLDLPVGVPTLANGIAVVPWASQRISLLDAATGVEQTRFHIMDTVVGTAFVHGNRVFTGQLVVFRVNAKIESGNKDGIEYYKPMARSYPNQPPLLSDGYQPVPPPQDLSWRIRLLWKPKAGEGEAGLEDDNLYFIYRKLLFALAPEEDKLKWIYSSAREIVGAEAREGGVMLVTEDGRVTLVDARTGAKTWEADMGVTGVAMARPRPGTFQKEAAAQAEPETMLSQIKAVAGLEDKQLADGIAFAIRFLKDFDDAAVTGDIVQMCVDRKRPPPVQFAACKALEGRKNGASYVAEALKKRASFLKGAYAPPAGSLARAAASMSMRGAVKDILAHLGDPATPISELGGIFEALCRLGDRAGIDAVDGFLRLYHAESEDKQLVAAAVSAAEALAEYEKGGARTTLDYVASDAFTAPELRGRAKALIAALEAPKKDAPKEEKPKAPEEIKDDRPERITGEMVQTTFNPVKKKLQKCIPEGTAQLKLVLIVEPAGGIASLATTPNSAEECAKKAAGDLKFPATKKQDNEQVVYIVYP